MDTKTQEKTFNKNNWKITIAVITMCLLMLCVVLAWGYGSFQIKNTLTYSLHTHDTVSETRSEENPSPQPGEIITKIKDGLVISSGRLPIIGSGAQILVNIPKETIKLVYDMKEGYISLNTNVGQIFIKTINESETSEELYRFTDKEGKTILAGIIDCYGCALSIAGMPTSADVEKELAHQMNSLVADLSPADENVKISIEDLHVVSAWTQNISITSDFIAIGNGEDIVTVSPYTKTEIEEAGFSESVTIEGTKKFMYGEYIDAETGLRPYLYVTNNAVLKIMCSGPEQLEEIFSAS